MTPRVVRNPARIVTARKPRMLSRLQVTLPYATFLQQSFVKTLKSLLRNCPSLLQAHPILPPPYTSGGGWVPSLTFDFTEFYLRVGVGWRGVSVG
ncbi:hypothetical protein M758_12G142500 [Ceratodon purpureus]|uniref:Uncharacterized protein n=1 Tax=Ceratodon purpureus TaxID=3225 RepID=A0A8T0G6Y0_CERPU|nr:hypothetical protein KC19_12G138900 [Ceratodon purpureus]KAG0599314.1 hypothetical protein M758_12G142500 [Ceratodon purpureus]